MHGLTLAQGQTNTLAATPDWIVRNYASQASPQADLERYAWVMTRVP
jgi:hypothetical protein